MVRWEKINAVQRMQDYIEEHLAQSITLHVLAQAAGYSPWHCASIFKELIGKTPFEYIRSLRLYQAAVKIRDENIRIIDVALDFVFETPEGLTRSLWMPENLRKKGTSQYTQGVEVPKDYSGEVPEGFDLIDLPPCKMMVFQGQPYYDDEKFEDEIAEVWEVMKNYKPEFYGFTWADEDGPRFQLAPMGYRGYIEARPFRQIKTDIS